MNYTVSKAWRYILKNFSYIALLTLLIILFLLNIEKQYRINEFLAEKDIVGTYIMGDETTGDAEYLVFDKNNCYYRYKQFNFIEKGEYEKIDDNVYVLVTDKNDSKEHFVHSNNKIYLFNSKLDAVHIYFKKADTPLFINVHTEERLP